MKLIVFILLAAVVINERVIAQNAGRNLKQIVTSDRNPEVEIEVDPAFSFIGRVYFDVDTIGRAEEFIFGELKDGKLSRIFIVHFEYFLPRNKFKFNYPRFRMATIGKQEYLHQIFFVRQFKLFRIKEVSDLFRAKGLTVEPDWLMNRYVRAVDSAKKNEMILFYLEPGGATPERIISEAEKSDPAETTTSKWQSELKARANAVFKIVQE